MHLRPKTFKPTIGMRPLQVARSKVSLSGNRRKASDTMNRPAAIASCAHRKNNGVAVVFKTHLLLKTS